MKRQLTVAQIAENERFELEMEDRHNFTELVRWATFAEDHYLSHKTPARKRVWLFNQAAVDRQRTRRNISDTEYNTLRNTIIERNNLQYAQKS